jgi:hypothetical protein
MNTQTIEIQKGQDMSNIPEQKDERLESLKTLYTYLEARYQEQVNLLKEVDTTIKTRLTIMSAVLGIMTFLITGAWKVSSPIVFLVLVVSMIPLFWAFMQVFFIAMQALERQLYTPGIAAEKMIALARYASPSLESLYEDLVKNLAVTLERNEEIITDRDRVETIFRSWNKRVISLAFLPFAAIIVLAVGLVIFL